MQVTTISPEQFLHTCDNQSVTVIDLRTVAEVSYEALSDSIHLPVQDLNPLSFEQALTLAKHQHKNIYLLCQSGIRANKAVEILTDKVEQRLVVIEGGLNALKILGVKTVKGAGKVISLERQVRITAGAMTLLGVVLGSVLHPYWYGLSAFVGVGLMFAGITNSCGMALILARMPWNKA
ncbi:MAG: rhodanese-like domain-containing protein [Thalassotalea sp.]